MPSDRNDEAGLKGPVEVAKYLGLSERDIFVMAEQGQIPAFKMGSTWRFRQSDLDNWLENSRSGPTVSNVESLTPTIVPARSKWRKRKDSEEADVAIKKACRDHIESEIKSVGKEIFLVESFEEKFGKDVVKLVIDQLKKEKVLKESFHEGLGGEQVRVVMRRQ